MTSIASVRNQARVTLLITAVSVAILMNPTQGHSQQIPRVAPPGTPSGLGTQITTVNSTQYNITGGSRPGSGPNLFHSFVDFGVPTGHIANFLNETGAPTTNIIGRVTGELGQSPAQSIINGTIQTQGFGNANLFLVNPAGFMFGSGATINVGGSANFVAGDYLRMTDNAQFFANPAQTSTLSVNPVSSFGFLSGNPLGRIQIQGNLTSTGVVLNLVSRNLADGTPGISVSNSTFTTNGGHLNLASVGTPQNLAAGGELTIDHTTPNRPFTVPTGHEFSHMGTIEITNSTLSTSAPLSPRFGVGALTSVANSGNIAMVANRINLRGSETGGQSKLITTATDKNAGDILLQANTVTIDQVDATTVAKTPAGPGADDSAYSAGDFVVTGVGGAGTRAGSVNISNSAIDLDGITSGPKRFAGSLRIDAENIAITNSGVRSVDNDHASGSISLDATHSLDIRSSDFRSLALSTGQAGTMQFVAGEIITISNSDMSSFGEVSPGRITIQAPRVFLNSSTLSVERHLGTSETGGISIIGDALTMRSGTIVANSSQGTASPISIEAGTITLTNGAQVLSQSINGTGGTISLAARAGDLQLTQATISSKGTGSASAGSIDLASTHDLLVRNSLISTQSENAGGGNIKLTAPNIIRIVDSTLSSSVQGQVGSNGGNISIDPQLVVIQNSNLLANANAGAGGNITVIASGAVLVDPNSQLNASAGPAGVSGSVNINTPVQVLGGALVPLKIAYTQAGLSGDRCAADPKGQFSSFVQTGRDGVPQVPGALSPSPLGYLDALQTPALGSSLGAITQEARLGLIDVSGSDNSLVRFHSGCRS